jgi:biopolymer transport protein ExbD
MMKRVGVRRARQEDEQLEGAIDIVFLLLIFFVLTSSFQILVGAKIKPPKKVEEELVVDHQKDIVLKIDSLSQVVLIYQKREYPIIGDALFKDGTEKLSAFLSVSQDAKVVVFADYDSPFGVVNTIELICTQLGVSPYICYERGQT